MSFLKEWHGEDKFFIFLLDTKTGKNMTFPHTVNSFEQYEKTIESYNEKGFNVYYTVNSFNSKDNVRRKDTVETIKAIWFDVDTPDTAEDIYKAITKEFGIPTYRIRTSKGKFQVLYKLEKPLPNTERNRFIVESVMKILAEHFGTDGATTGIQQIFRLPGYKNMKYTNMNSYVEKRTKRVYGLKKFVKFANKVKKTKVFEKKINKYELQDVEITVDKYEPIGEHHKKIYGFFLKKKNRDASVADILYLKNRKEAGVSFEVAMKEICELRDYYKYPFKRQFSLYYSDRENLYYDM